MKLNLSKVTLLFATTAFLAGLSSAAYADSVRVVTNLKIEGQSVKMEKEVGFTPQGKTIVVPVAGKTCTFGSSRQGSVPKGCNYTITIDENGVTPSVREASSVCMQTPMSCK